MRYFAFYSSQLGGIVTDPSLMVLPFDDHMVHQKAAEGTAEDPVFHGVRPEAGISCTGSGDAKQSGTPSGQQNRDDVDTDRSFALCIVGRPRGVTRE